MFDNANINGQIYERELMQLWTNLPGVVKFFARYSSRLQNLSSCMTKSTSRCVKISQWEDIKEKLEDLCVLVQGINFEVNL